MNKGCWTRLLARSLCAAVLLPGAVTVRAQTGPLLPQTVLVPGSSAPSTTEETFSIASVASGSTQPDLLVTFTDLKTPAALMGANVAVTQGAAIVASAVLAAGSTTTTLTLPAAVGQFTLRVVGTPDATAGAGTFTVCVAPKTAPTACATGSIAGSIAAPAMANSTVSTLAITLTVVTAGSYTFTYADDQFPVALAVPPTLALFQGSNSIAVPIAASPAVIPLTAGTYSLLVFAKADPTVMAGLFGITVSGPAGVAPLLNSAYPVGLLAPASAVTNPSAQSVTLTVSDFAFPDALASASAVLTSGGTLLGSAAAGAPATFAAPMGSLQLWSYGVAGTGAGTYEVELTSMSSGSLISQLDAGVSSSGEFAYAFVTPQALTAAGSYQATANDFQFPAALNGLQFAVAQNGAILDSGSAKSTTAGSVSFTTAAAPAGAVPAVLLVAATPVANGTGLFDVNIQTGGNAPQLVFDQVQPVSASGGFTSQPIVLAAGSYDATLTDLQFPAAFGTLALVSSSNGAVLGKVYGGGTFTLDATAGSYQFTIVAIPATPQGYGLYGLQILDSPPTVTLTASPATVVAGGSTTLSWTTTNATSCSGSGGTFSGNQAAGTGMVAVTVAATTTYTLSCTGPGGSAANTATVTATTTPPSSGGGGEISLELLGLLGALAVARRRSMPVAAAIG